VNQEMNGKNIKTIVIHAGTKKLLDGAKEVPYESYNRVIERALIALTEKQQQGVDYYE
jgi:hypothetical protein